MRSNLVASKRLLLPLASLFALASLSAAAQNKTSEKRVLMIGGGPTPKHNQVSIESNIRYMLRLVPNQWISSVLFADGSKVSETVLFEEKYSELPVGEKIVALLTQGREAANPTALKFRAANLDRLDGASRKPDIASAFEKLAHEANNKQPLFLYFTGHGSQARDRNLENNVFDLWGNSSISVRELAAQINKLPSDQPLTLVMVQCFSGAFGNLLFTGGDPLADITDRDFVGFFAAVKERVAAGCTPEADENEYRDFTSYFFAALTGRDRMGRRVTGADYDRDGKVSMDEAYCYTLINDVSIDVPVCTTDVFLRRYVKTADVAVFDNRYAEVLKWASPGQRAALEQLSRSLGLAGDDRAKLAYEKFARTTQQPSSAAVAQRTYQRARRDARTALLERFPDLKDMNAPRFEEIRKEAATFAAGQANDGAYKELLDAEKQLEKAEMESYKRELEEARLTRFVRLFKTVALAHELRGGNEEALKARFEKLVKGERQTLLPPADSVKAAQRP